MSQSQADVLSRIESLANAYGTREFPYNNSYIEASSYIKRKYEQFYDDVVLVKCYLVTGRFMDAVGFYGASGLFVESIDSIFVRRQTGPLGRYNEPDGLWEYLLRKYSCSPSYEEILVHEFMHKVSACLNRHSRSLLFMEEEFVYANCIDYYRSSPQHSEKDLESLMLPFMIQQIINTEDGLEELFDGRTPTRNDILFARLTKPRETLRKAESIARDRIKQLISLHSAKLIDIKHSGSSNLKSTSKTSVSNAQDSMIEGRFSILSEGK